jgi:uncharacterized protein YxjI
MQSIVENHRRILVRQAKEWGEILTGFETRNRYHLFDEEGNQIGYAAEEGGGLGTVLLRNFLGRCRACTIHLYDRERQKVGRGVKPFRFYFHRMEVHTGDRKIGAIQRKFSILNRDFAVEGPDGRQLLLIRSPLFRIWTFKLLKDGEEVGRISKKWSGLLKEAFTDADNFGVEFAHPDLPEEVKQLLLVAVFLVDFVCFEKSN